MDREEWSARSKTLRYGQLATMLGGMALLAHLMCDENDGYLGERLQAFLPSSAFHQTAECAGGSGFTDKNLEDFKDKVSEGVDKLVEQNPNVQRVRIQSGLRGTRYFIEFPIDARNFDAYSLLQKVQQKLENAKGKKYNVRVTQTDSYLKDDQVAYLVDYLVNSSQVEGTRCPGSVYIRGVKGQEGLDSFKFTLEKGQDFSELDVQLCVAAYSEALTLSPLAMQQQGAASIQPSIDEANMTPAQRKFSRRMAAKNTSESQSGIQGGPGAGAAGIAGMQQQQADESDPATVLEKHGCSVFLPNKASDALDWDYLAGYRAVKRDIEDTVLLALTHGDVYDQITAATRMKNETNRPRCVLFEGPPGCGKTTSAKIISQQVDIPLVYMPLEAIMSKYYGESESKLAEIFEAAAAMGSVIVFIDEVDSLATSREAGLHEATRRILSTLLRKIDSFESEGEVLVICATNRKKDLDPALVSRLDLSIRFELPDASTRAAIFQRYAKQLSSDDLQQIGDLAVNLSGRDIADICKDAERKWASKYIRKEVTTILPTLDVYIQATKTRLAHMQDSNLRMDSDFNPALMADRLAELPMKIGN